MTTLGALVILYHPSDAQLDALGAWRHACDALLVVDNTPQPDARAASCARARASRCCITAIAAGSRARTTRAAALFRDRIDAVALFDRIRRCRPRISRDARSVRGAWRAPVLAGARIFDENARSFLPELSTNGIGLRRLRIEPGASLQRCAFLISSGCVVSRDAFDVLGRFDETLFIDHVDTEYSFRALSRNVPLYVVPSLVLPHRIGAKQRHALGPLK